MSRAHVDRRISSLDDFEVLAQTGSSSRLERVCMILVPMASPSVSAGPEKDFVDYDLGKNQYNISVLKFVYRVGHG